MSQKNGVNFWITIGGGFEMAPRLAESRGFAGSGRMGISRTHACARELKSERERGRNRERAKGWSGLGRGRGMQTCRGKKVRTQRPLFSYIPPRERIDLKLGVAAVSTGRKPMLQSFSICIQQILDRA